MGEPGQDIETLRDALDEARETGDATAEAGALYHLGRLYRKMKVFEAATEYWAACLEACRTSGHSAGLVQVLLDLGDLALEQGEQGQAGRRYEEALARCRAEFNLPGQARAWDRLANLARARGQAGMELDCLEQGLELCRSHDDRIGGLYFLDQVVPLLKRLNRSAEARQAYREVITWAEKIGDRERMALGLVGLADLYDKAGEQGEARPCLMMAHDLYLRLGKEAEALLIRRQLEATGPVPGLSGSGAIP